MALPFIALLTDLSKLLRNVVEDIILALGVLSSVVVCSAAAMKMSHFPLHILFVHRVIIIG